MANLFFKRDIANSYSTIYNQLTRDTLDISYKLCGWHWIYLSACRDDDVNRAHVFFSHLEKVVGYKTLEVIYNGLRTALSFRRNSLVKEILIHFSRDRFTELVINYTINGEIQFVKSVLCARPEYQDIEIRQLIVKWYRGSTFVFRRWLDSINWSNRVVHVHGDYKF